jgi:hypothetical protein
VTPGIAMRRWKLIAALALGVLALVAVGAFVLWPQTDRITQENCERIHSGMSQTNVEAILGPPGDNTSGPIETEWDPNWTVPNSVATKPYGAWPLWDKDDYQGGWFSDTRVLYVVFDSNAKVRWVQDHKVTRLKQSPLDNLRWRAKRLWCRWFPE